MILFVCFYSASEKISENMHIIANDPSLAFYRMQEHIRKGNSQLNPIENYFLKLSFFFYKVMPMIVERRAEVEHLQHELQGRCYDLEYSLR